MPIRPIDPAGRGIRPVVSSKFADRATSEPAPGHKPRPVLRKSSVSSDTIVVRERTRSRQFASASAVPTALKAASPAAKRAHHIVDRSGSNWQDGDYLVGRGRPPKSAQWHKGQSGNPRGPKPQEKLDPEAAFEKEIFAEFTAKVNGEQVKLNMGSFVVQLLKAGAAKGTVKSQQMLLELFLATVRKSVAREDTPAMAAWEQQVIDQMLEEYDLPAQPVFRKTDRTLPEADPS